MQQLQLLLLVVLGSAAIVAVVLRLTGRDRASDGTARVVVGFGAGTLGALIVLVLRTDLLPDDMEQLVLPLLIVFGTLALFAVFTLRRS
jgi:peptidoglycan/LPS O-acetylase OafA/YrhL